MGEGARDLSACEWINARLDLWHLRAGMDMAQWMCNEIDLADRVVVVCNEAYPQRADGRHGGVGWEIRLIEGDLKSNQATTKYVPVIRADDIAAATPRFLRPTRCIPGGASRPDGELRRELLDTLREAPLEPPLGSVH